jgi:hypothetical protein
MSRAAKAKSMVLAVEIPRHELACRIAEASIGLKRPPGVTAIEALAQLRAVEPDTVASFYRVADRAVLFFHECVNAGKAPN